MATTVQQKVLVFTATYNESGNIHSLVKKVFAAIPHCNFLVVDDNSPDGTGKILDDLTTTYPGLKVIHRNSKLGLGTAHKLAMIYAIKHGYDVLLTLDADLSHDPDDLPRLLAALVGADYVTGSRYAKGGKCDYQGYRRVVSKLANWSVRMLLGTRLYESTTSLRGYRIALLKDLPFHRIRSDGYSFFLETAYWIEARKYRCREVPIHFHDRTAGVSKIPRLQILFGMMLLLRLFALRILRVACKETGANLPPEDCYFCRSPYLVEKYKPLGKQQKEITSVQCTSMEHNNKPRVVQCLCCGLCYVPHSDSDSKPLLELYENTEDKTYLEQRGGREKTFAHVYRVIAKHLPSTGKMLELGSYCGLFLKLAREKGWNTTGLEPSQWASAYARDSLSLDVRTGTLTDHLDRLSTDFDAVVAWDVLEHLEDPIAELRKVYSVLADNGLFCFSTLDIDNWFPQLLGRRWPWIMEMHLFYFSVTTLKAMLRETGFELVAVTPYCHYISVSYFFKKLQALFFGKVGKGKGVLDRLLGGGPYIPFRFGDIKLFVCRKISKAGSVNHRTESLRAA